MRTRLRLFLEWGITFEEPYIVPERADRAVAYANREDLEHNLPKSNKAEDVDVSGAYAVSGRGGMAHEPAVDMADKNSLIRQITDAMETEIIPFPGGTMSLGDIERRLRELEQQFQTLLEKAADDPAAYGGQFKEILDEQTFLKEKRSVILANNNEQAKANQRIMDAAQTLENASPYITEWDESAVRQLVETVKILSKDEVAVTLKGGIEICQKIMY